MWVRASLALPSVQRKATGTLSSAGTLLRRMKMCGKPGCRCAEDPKARHGPYYEWGHMKGGKLVHRTVTAEQAALLQRAIANYRKAKKLMKAWEHETERLVENEAPHEH